MRLPLALATAALLWGCSQATPGTGSSGTASNFGASASGTSGSSGASASGTSGSSGASATGSTGGSGSTGSTGSGSTGSTGGSGSTGGRALGHVFVIVMENHNWAQFDGNTAEAPYINTLIGTAATCAAYHDSGVHPSLPNYLWMEAGSNLGITSDHVPTGTQGSGSSAVPYLQTTTDHLVTHLDGLGVTWRTYMEGMTAGTCPIANAPATHFAARHNPVLYFSDVVGDPAGSDAARCAAHVVPYSQLATDLASGQVAQYTFITPNLCHDMHDACGGDAIAHGDTWLSQAIPAIEASSAFQHDGVIFVTWDESEMVTGSTCNHEGCPIGMIAISPFARAGFVSATAYTHSALLRTVETIFGVRPFTRDAANATDLRELFTRFP